MGNKKILITAATGVTGSAAAANLLGLGIQVRALVHRIDARSEQLRAQGAEIIEGDLLDFAVLDKSADWDHGGIFLLSNSDPGNHRIDCLLRAGCFGRRRRHRREHVADISTQDFQERGCEESLDS